MIPPAFPPDLAARLRSETCAASVELHVELGSTNDRALELARGERPPLPAVILTERQTAGRGRGANRWVSDGGGLTFTVLLDAGPFSGRVATLAPLAGLSVRDALAAVAPRPSEVRVKWPNDVRVGTRKVAGILCEAAAGCVAVGVGINVGGLPADLPPDVRDAAASLPVPDRPALLVDLLRRLETDLRAFAAGGVLDAARWRRCDALAGREITVDAGGQPITGVASGVEPDGALRLFDGRTLHAVRSGTVTWIGGTT